MKYVIELSEKDFDNIKHAYTAIFGDIYYIMQGAIANGKALEQEPKMGHWILVDNLFHKYKCSNCGDIIWTDESHNPYIDSPYCCKCGCRMVKPQKREDKE